MSARENRASALPSASSFVDGQGSQPPNADGIPPRSLNAERADIAVASAADRQHGNRAPRRGNTSRPVPDANARETRDTPSHAVRAELYDELAYQFDGSLEGLFSAVFASYERHEEPTDLLPGSRAQIRLGQQVVVIETDLARAERVRTGFRRACGSKALAYATRAALSDEPQAASAVYRYIRHGMSLNARRDCARCRRRARCAGASNPTGSPGAAHCPRVRGAMTSDLSHPAVQPVFRLARSVFAEQEHLLQFARFEHLEGGLWFARCNPKANVVPLVMDHFASRFNMQSFLIYDEAHHLAGVHGKDGWSLMSTEGLTEPHLPDRATDEAAMQHAWRRFYQAVSVESRYNPELRQRLMPKRFWRNLTEMQEELPSLVHPHAGPDVPEEEPGPALTPR